jgi:hypothetical protein
VLQLWERVRPQLQTSLRTLGITGVPFARRADLAALDDIIDVQVPELRKAATKVGAVSGEAAQRAAAAAATAETQAAAAG